MTKKTRATKRAETIKAKPATPLPLSDEEAEAVRGGGFASSGATQPDITSSSQLRDSSVAFHNYEPTITSKATRTS